MKVEFTNTFDSKVNFEKLCKSLGINYQLDPNYKRHFAGCDAPDIGYIIDFKGSIHDLQEAAKGDLFVENLINY